MFYKIISRVKFLWESTNQHGVHSPFVYDFVTKGLYIKKHKQLNFSESFDINTLSKKETRIFEKIANYFTIIPNQNQTKTNSYDYSLILFDDLSFSIDEIEVIRDSENILVFQRIYKSKENHKKWLELLEIKEATVTIDLFYFGLIFFRKEQAKEHFKIRV